MFYESDIPKNIRPRLTTIWGGFFCGFLQIKVGIEEEKSEAS